VKQYSGLFLRVGFLFVLALMLVVAPTKAQVISGDLVGTVFDKSGAVVPNASVEAVNLGTGVKYTAQAGETGEYRFNNLPVGTYKVSASAPNFATTTVDSFKIELNKTPTLPLTLEVKGTTAEVEVSGVALALDTTTSTVTNVFDEKAMADLPAATQGLGVLNLSLLGSGVASSGGIGAGTGPSVGGQRPRNNNFTIEGVDNNNKSVTGPLVYVPNDAVSEFSVLQNQYSPEFGHSSGGQFNQVVKSGTNQIHGVAYLYSQNKNFNAMDQVAKNSGFTENQRYDNNRIGGSIGGPVVKNKFFYYVNFEYNPIGQAFVPSAVCTPTAAGFSTLDSLVGTAGLSQTNLTEFQKYATAAPTGGNCSSVASKDPSGKANAGHNIFITNPAAASGFTPVEVGATPIAGAAYTNNWAGVVSLDYDISERDQLRGRYIYNRSDGLDNTPAFPVFYEISPNHYHLVTISEYHTFSPSLTNEFRLGFNRYYNVTPGGSGLSYPGLDRFPNLSWDELGGTQIGPDPNGPQFFIQNGYQASENLSWTKGRHTLKVGVEGHKYISPQQFTQRSRGDYDYSTLDLFLHDQTPDGLAERSVGLVTYYGDQSAIYWYANDEWRLRPNFTVNLGLRYEYTTIPSGERLQSLNQAASVPGLIDFSEPRAPKNNWGPRVGLAYSPGRSGKTSIRAGAGISYDVRYDNIGILSLPPQVSVTIDCPDARCAPNGSFLAGGGIVPTPPSYPDVASQRFATSNHIVVDELSPKSFQWTLGVQHTFWNDYTVEVRYLGTRGVHLNTQERINRQPLTNSKVFLPTYVTAPDQATLDALPYTKGGIAAGKYGNGDSIVPAFDAAGFNGSNVVQFTPNGNSTYHGLATQVTKRMTHGLQFVGSYTYSHTIDDSTADFFSTILTPRRPQDFQNLSADRANSALDRRHRFTLAAIYDMPFFKNSNWLAKNVLGNWEVAPVYTYQSPEWATVQSGAGHDVNGNGDTWGDRVIFNKAGKSGTGTDVVPLCNSSLPAGKICGAKGTNSYIVAYQAIDPTAQYIRGGIYSLPNVGRNTLATRHINNFDLTAVKRFNFSERYKAEFVASAFNLFNHAQFIPGSLNNINSIGYTSNATRSYLTPGSDSFDKPESLFSSNPRTLQLGLKLFF
jgi:hypothetical protein